MKASEIYTSQQLADKIIGGLPTRNRWWRLTALTNSNCPIQTYRLQFVQVIYCYGITSVYFIHARYIMTEKQKQKKLKAGPERCMHSAEECLSPKTRT